MKKVALAGRLLSENKGIDSLIQTVISYRIDMIIICGEEVIGHKAGNALALLHKNGIDTKGKIVGSTSPEPILQSKPNQVKQFQNQVRIINKIGVSNFQDIKRIVNSIKI